MSRFSPLTLFGGLAVFVLMLTVGCSSGPSGGGGAGDEDGDTNGTDGGAEPLALADVRFWGYQIQSVDEPGAVDGRAITEFR